MSKEKTVKKRSSKCKVADIDIKDNHILADVIDNENKYEVKLFLKSSFITDMTCTCKSDDHTICNHIFAVIDKYNEYQHNKYIEVKSKETLDVIAEELVQDADDDTVRSFLIQVLRNDKMLLDSFYTILKAKSSILHTSLITNKIDEILSRYSNNSKYIFKDEIPYFVNDFIEYVHYSVNALVDNELYIKAFDVVCYAFLLLDHIELEYDDGIYMNRLCDDISVLWPTILVRMTNSKKQIALNWFEKHCNTLKYKELNDVISAILLSKFNSSDYNKQMMKISKTMIKHYENVSDIAKLTEWVIHYISLLDTQDGNNLKLKKIVDKYYEYDDIRNVYINLCLEKKNYEEAIRYIDLIVDKIDNKSVRHYYLLKMDILRLLGDRKTYVAHLIKLLNLFPKDGVDEIYRKIKDLYTKEEWEQSKSEILSDLNDIYEFVYIYKEEKMYDRLLACCRNGNFYYLYEEIYDLIMDKYPKEVLDDLENKVYKYIDEKNANLANPKIKRIIEKMLEVNGGKDCVTAIAKNIKEKYKTRHALHKIFDDLV